MEIIKYILKDTFNLPKHFRKLYGDIPFALFDIETTGLNPNYNKIILIGILYYKNNALVLEQLFCDSKEDEFHLLNCFIERIKDIPLLISYNGDSFDIPFLTKRIASYEMASGLPPHCSLDLLKIVRNCKNQLNLKDCKLKSVEKSLGIEREDQISGKESVDLYMSFERTKDKSLKDIILLHNHDDLRYLFQVMSVLDKITFDNLLSKVPLLISESDEKIWTINSTNIKGNTVSISGIFLGPPMNDYIVHKTGFSFNYSSKDKTYILKIPLYKITLDSGDKYLYINLDDYPFDYIPKSEINSIAPNNIVVFKKNKDLNNIDIYEFPRALLLSILENLLETNV